MKNNYEFTDGDGERNFSWYQDGSGFGDSNTWGNGTGGPQESGYGCGYSCDSSRKMNGYGHGNGVGKGERKGKGKAMKLRQNWKRNPRQGE